MSTKIKINDFCWPLPECIDYQDALMRSSCNDDDDDDELDDDDDD